MKLYMKKKYMRIKFIRKGEERGRKLVSKVLLLPQSTQELARCLGFSIGTDVYGGDLFDR